jgi:SH3-like domain-containing protein
MYVDGDWVRARGTTLGADKLELPQYGSLESNDIRILQLKLCLLLMKKLE